MRMIVRMVMIVAVVPVLMIFPMLGFMPQTMPHPARHLRHTNSKRARFINCAGIADTRRTAYDHDRTRARHAVDHRRIGSYTKNNVPRAWRVPEMFDHLGRRRTSATDTTNQHDTVGITRWVRWVELLVLRRRRAATVGRRTHLDFGESD
ncbi:MAG TPA: hypothetical protein VGM50_21585 [Gemmatimonadaceae bacterium]|jgi:hypothetical protein